MLTVRCVNVFLTLCPRARRRCLADLLGCLVTTLSESWIAGRCSRSCARFSGLCWAHFRSRDELLNFPQVSNLLFDFARVWRGPNELATCLLRDCPGSDLFSDCYDLRCSVGQAHTRRSDRRLTSNIRSVGCGCFLFVLVGMALAVLSADGGWPGWPSWAAWIALSVNALSMVLNWITPSKE